MHVELAFPNRWTVACGRLGVSESMENYPSSSGTRLETSGADNSPFSPLAPVHPAASPLMLWYIPGGMYRNEGDSGAFLPTRVRLIAN